MPDLVRRRIVFQGLGSLGVAAVLAGCGGESSDSPRGSELAASGTALAGTDEVPVGGGLVLTDSGVVLTQPSAGTFRAFTAVCTHQGAGLDAVSEEGIECPLHGSRFSIDDGSVTQGPATDALAEVPVTVEGDQVVVA